MPTLGFSPLYTDQYQLSMAQVYFHAGRHHEPVVFDYFFRKLPFDGGYAVLAGMETLVEFLERFCFFEEDLDYLRQSGRYSPDFLEYLWTFRFRGSLYAMPEGEVVFPLEPIVQVHGTLLEAQLIETLLLNTLNFQTLIATKARRIHGAARGRSVLEFGLRRAQGLGGYHASRAAIIGGCQATSHVQAAKDFAVPSAGTMAHSFIQSFGSELEAFQSFAEHHPKNCVLLIDTYDTLHSGLPHAIQVAQTMKKRGQALAGIRLDSGDLAYLSKKCRHALDQAGLPEVKIIASNQLDEYVIKSLLEEDAPIDSFGVGTSLAVGKPDAALDGVYKLSQINNRPSIKISESLEKCTIPAAKQVYRLAAPGLVWTGADLITQNTEDPAAITTMHHPFDPLKTMKVESLEKTPLLKLLIKDGQRLHPARSVLDIQAQSLQTFEQLPNEYKRFANPHLYKVGLSAQLYQLRQDLIDRHLKT